MALLWEHSAEGSTDEADVAANVTTYGDAFSTVNKVGAFVIKYDSARAMHGTRSIRMTRAATTDSGDVRTVLGAAVARMQVRAYVWIDTLPSTAQDNLFVLRSAGGFMGYLGWRSDGKLQAYNSANTGIANSVASAAFPTAQWVRVEAAIQAGTDTTNGTIEYAYYLGDSTTAVARWATTGTTGTVGAWALQNTGIENPIQVRTGLNGATVAPANMWLDTLAVGDGTGFLGPASAGAPTASVTNNVRGVIDARGSSGTGALSYAIDPTTNTEEYVPGLWGVTQTSSAQTFTVTVSVSGGGSDTESVTVPALSSGSTSGIRRYQKIGGVIQ